MQIPNAQNYLKYVGKWLFGQEPFAGSAALVQL